MRVSFGDRVGLDPTTILEDRSRPSMIREFAVLLAGAEGIRTGAHTFVALVLESKLVSCWYVVPRSCQDTAVFITDLRSLVSVP